jgi:hypothetical protein
MLRELLNVQPDNRGTSLAGALGFARNVLRKRSVCFILSDFWTDNYQSSHCGSWHDVRDPPAFTAGILSKLPFPMSDCSAPAMPKREH